MSLQTFLRMYRQRPAGRSGSVHVTYPVIQPAAG
jgi:hypothetical protein